MGIQQLPLLLNSGGTAAPRITSISLSEETPRVIKRLGPSNLIVDQVPDFINKDHETFRRFVEAYYEWLEQYQNAFGIIDAFTEHTDIDQTIGLFTENFRSMYLANFPSRLATDSNGNIVSEANFLKNARRFYGSKGTEKGFRFLFRLIYNTSMEIKYPAKDVLKCSAGEWIERISIKTTSEGGTANFGMIGEQVYQIDPVTGNILSYATVSDVIQYSVQQYPVTEIFLKNVTGNFVPNSKIYVKKGSITLSETVYPVVSAFEIVNGGLGYEVGDPIGITASGDGLNLFLSVGVVDLDGRIREIRVGDSGVGYYTAPILNVVSNTGNGTARVIAKVGGITYYPGYYFGNKGKLSSTTRLFDSDYYQEYSYVLRSEISLARYKELYKKLIHPAGFKMFGEILIKRNIIDSLPFHSEMQRYEIPFIGHYTPYRMGTTADLFSKYLNGFNPRGQVFSSTQNYGQSGGKLFVTPRIAGTTFNSSSAWIVVGASGAQSLGISGSVFEFRILNSAATYGVLLLKEIDFNVANTGTLYGDGFVVGATLTMRTASTGFTATIDRIQFGTGIVLETGGSTHQTLGLPLGASGSVEGYIEAKGFSYPYWSIHHHPNTRSIYGLTGVWNGLCGPGASFGAIALNPFFKMPIGYHFHSNAAGTPYAGTTGTNNEYGLIEGTNLTSPNY